MPSLPSPVRALATLSCLALAGCRDGRITDTNKPPETSLGTASTAIPPASTNTPAPIHSAETPAAAPTSWLGVPVDRAIRFSGSLRVAYDVDPRYSAEINVPLGWHSVPLVNAMNGQTDARMAISPDKTAHLILMIYTQAIWHEAALDSAVGRWLTISGGVSAIQPWSPPTPTEIGERRTPGSRLMSSGILGRDDAELWQVRRRFPSAANGKRALIALGAIRRAAPPVRRAEFLAALASFSPVPQE